MLKLEARGRGEKECKERSNGSPGLPFPPPRPGLEIHDSSVKNNQEILAQAEGILLKNDLETCQEPQERLTAKQNSNNEVKIAV